MNTSIDLSFEVVSQKSKVNSASVTCSGSQSDCCTRVCSQKRVCRESSSSIEAWEQYLEINAGVLQY